VKPYQLIAAQLFIARITACILPLHVFSFGHDYLPNDDGAEKEVQAMILPRGVSIFLIHRYSRRIFRKVLRPPSQQILWQSSRRKRSLTSIRV
jgi:hypothetical protein